MQHVDDAVSELLGGGHRLWRMRHVEQIDREHRTGLAAGRLHFVEAPGNVVFLAQQRQLAIEAGQRQPLPARALHRLENDPGDLVAIGFHQGFERPEGPRRQRLVFRFGPSGIGVRERHLQIAGDDAAKILGGDGIVGQGRDVERVDGAPVEGLIEIDEARIGGRASLGQLLVVVEIDEIFHHVLDRLGAGIDGIDLDAHALHAFRRQLVQQPVIGQAFRGQEIRIGDLGICGHAQAPEIVRLVHALVVVPDQLRTIQASPVEHAVAIDRNQGQVVGLLQVDGKRKWFGNDVFCQFAQQGSAFGS